VIPVDPQALEQEWERLSSRTVDDVSFRQLRFSVMHGNGNVILVVDERLSGLTPDDVGSRLAREVCQAIRAVRVDGIAFLRSTADRVRMTYFERDGTHSQMCGNALRCSTRYCAERGYIPDEAVITTDDGDKWVSSAGGVVRVAIGPGREFCRVADDRYFVFSGLPHLVVLTDDLDRVDVMTDGAALRYDEDLARRLHHPEGLHVDFLQRDGDGIRIRTYEVGVEAETLACGTGVAGSAYVAHRIWGLPYPVQVGVPGGEMRVDESEHGLLISGVTGYLFRPVRAAVAV
jgi:diaminopimelate epimerase